MTQITMKIINKIHRNGEWAEYNPNFTEKQKEFSTHTGLDNKYLVEGFRKKDGRLVVRLTHDELNYTAGQSKKGIELPIEYKISEYGYRKDHYHYYFPENIKLGTYTCSSCQEVKKSKLKCCKDPSDDFFGYSYDDGYYDYFELVCVWCFIKRNLFDYDCRLEDNGDYVIKS